MYIHNKLYCGVRCVFFSILCKMQIFFRFIRQGTLISYTYSWGYFRKCRTGVSVVLQWVKPSVMCISMLEGLRLSLSELCFQYNFLLMCLEVGADSSSDTWVFCSFCGDVVRVIGPDFGLAQAWALMDFWVMNK